MTTTTRRPNPPSPRGRRGHPIIPEIEGLSAWLIERFQRTPRPALAEIREELRATGFWRKLQELGHENGIAKSTIWEFWVDFRAQQAEKDFTLDLAAQYNDVGGDHPVLEIESAAKTLVTVELYKGFLKAVREGVALSDEKIEQFR